MHLGERVNNNRVAIAVFVIGSMIGTYFLSGPRKRKSRNELYDKQQEEVDRNLTTPANATFGVVWPIIYSGITGLAVHQALPSQSNNLRYQKATPWFITSFLLNTVFGFFFSSDTKNSRIGAALTTIANLPSSIMLHQSLEIGKTAVAAPENILQKFVSLYAGWLTAASVISIGNLFLQAGCKVSPQQAVKWANGVLSFTGVLGPVVAKKLNDPYYLLPFVAAFTGVSVKQYGKQNSVSLLAGIGSVGILLIFGKYLIQQKGMHKSVSTDNISLLH